VVAVGRTVTKLNSRAGAMRPISANVSDAHMYIASAIRRVSQPLLHIGSRSKLGLIAGKDSRSKGWQTVWWSQGFAADSERQSRSGSQGRVTGRGSVRLPNVGVIVSVHSAAPLVVCRIYVPSSFGIT